MAAYFSSDTVALPGVAGFFKVRSGCGCAGRMCVCVGQRLLGAEKLIKLRKRRLCDPPLWQCILGCLTECVKSALSRGPSCSPCGFPLPAKQTNASAARSDALQFMDYQNMRGGKVGRREVGEGGRIWFAMQPFGTTQPCHLLIS